MELKIIEDYFYKGAPMIAIQLKIFHFEGLPLDEGKLIDTLKNCKGAFQIGYDTRLDYYGPFSFDLIRQNDFYKLNENTLTDKLIEFKSKIPELYFGDEEPAKNTMIDFLKTKLPEDLLCSSNIFVFKWNYANDNEKTGPSLDIMGYDYFFSVIATSNSKVCLITIWFD